MLSLVGPTKEGPPFNTGDSTEAPATQESVFSAIASAHVPKDRLDARPGRVRNTRGSGSGANPAPPTV